MQQVASWGKAPDGSTYLLRGVPRLRGERGQPKARKWKRTTLLLCCTRTAANGLLHVSEHARETRLGRCQDPRDQYHRPAARPTTQLNPDQGYP
jgi:hypothetical protein